FFETKRFHVEIRQFRGVPSAYCNVAYFCHGKFLLAFARSFTERWFPVNLIFWIARSLHFGYSFTLRWSQRAVIACCEYAVVSLKQFVAFATVAKHRSITQAARALAVSQPSISKHLKLLENKYKVKLFSRETGRLELTEDGLGLLEDVEIVLSQLDKI